MTESLVTVAVEGQAGVITLNRPAKRNALTVPMWQLITAACHKLADDRRVRSVLLTGTGASFCAGADISALSMDDAVLKAVAAEAESALRGLGVPTVALIQGHCWGGGVQLAVACDLRIGTDDATFAVPPSRLGVVYPAASLQAMVALVGPAVAKRLVYSGDPIDAATAARVGLIDEVVTPHALLAAGQAMVASFEGRSLLSQAAAKAMINAAVEGGDLQARYAEFIERWAASEDGREGPAAFLAKRVPVYTWHPADQG